LILFSEALRLFMHGVLKLLLRVHRRGEKLPATGPALVAANHYSFLDAFLMGSGTRRWIRYLLWKPYYENKYAQPFAKALFCIPMAQEGIREIVANLRGAQAVIKEGHMVGIFPEGEITRTGAMAPFRRGYEKILQGTTAPIIPMHLSGLWKHPLSPTPAPWFPWRRWNVTISIGKPLPPETTPEELQRQVLRLIGETLAERFRDVALRERDTPAVGTLTFGEWWRESNRRKGGTLEAVSATDDREFAIAVMAAILTMGNAPIPIHGVPVRQQDLLATIESAAMFGTPTAGRLYELLFAMAMGWPLRPGAGDWLIYWEMGGPVAFAGKPLLGVIPRVDDAGMLHLLGPGRETEWATGEPAAGKITA
jgi:1-acyl-sn-glycerol-3-phosphate acyltransferase